MPRFWMIWDREENVISRESKDSTGWHIFNVAISEFFCVVQVVKKNAGFFRFFKFLQNAFFYVTAFNGLTL